jgi:Protein of unknown function (DUF3631)
VNQKLLSNARTVLDDWLGGEIKGGEYVAINPLRNDSSTGSFSINLVTGVWKDFAVEGFAGPDLVSLYMALNDLDESSALDTLEEYLANRGMNNLPVTRKHVGKPKMTEVQSVPAPLDCHMPPDIHPDLGAPSMTWDYRTAEGQTAFSVYRFDTDNGKETRPVCYNPEQQNWQWKLPVPPLPVYHLDLLAGNPDTSVVVVEGEKAADAASERFPNHISTTSASGSSNALKSDWSPLYGREVSLIPDADEPGMKYAKTVVAELLVNGTDVFIIDTLALGWSDGNDVADYPDLDQDWLLEQRVPIREWDGFKGMDELIIAAAARLSHLDYDRRKNELVELLGGVNKRTLDGLVKQVRQNQANYKLEESESCSTFSGEEPWPERVDGKALLNEIQSVIRSHVILSAQEALAVALWIILTYVFRAFRVCPRLLVSSPEKRCGKTTLLEIIQAMCFRGLATANISAASLFRSLEAWSPTLLIDEADTFLKGNDELRGILNSGHTKSTAFVIRTVGDEHEPKRFSTFAPIAIGMIKRPADTLLDRSIVIRLQRKLGTDPVTSLPLEAENEYQSIRQKCLRWSEDTIGELQGDRELTPTDIGNDRARDNWVPLAAIAQKCNLLPEARTACRQLTPKEDGSLTITLLADIQQIFYEENKDKLPSKTLVKKLLAMEERPWAEYSRGKPLTQNKLAQLFKDFDVHTHQAKVGVKNLKHYLRSDLKSLFERYLKKDNTPPPPKVNATSLPTTQDPIVTGLAAVADKVAVALPSPVDATIQTTAEGLSSKNGSKVALDETLPLPNTSPPAHTEHGLQPGSGVAVKNKVKKLSFPRASSQGGN